MRITHLELVSNGEHIGSTPIREQAVNAAKAHANRHGVEVDVIATMEDGSTRKITVKPDGSVDRVWQREYIDPIPGVIYHNRNGADYKCISSMSDHSAIMERVKDMLTNGTHQLRVEAVDGNFATSIRVWNFSKAENTIAFQFSAPEETDARATKILITPTWKIEGAVAKVEACNNAFDAVPTWEDITAMVQLNRVFNFTNETKTADKWGVNVRFTIVKNEGYEGEVSISGFGGAYE